LLTRCALRKVTDDRIPAGIIPPEVVPFSFITKAERSWLRAADTAESFRELTRHMPTINKATPLPTVPTLEYLGKTPRYCVGTRAQTRYHALGAIVASTFVQRTPAGSVRYFVLHLDTCCVYNTTSRAEFKADARCAVTAVSRKTAGRPSVASRSTACTRRPYGLAKSLRCGSARPE
jgi:hypothetical protein